MRFIFLIFLLPGLFIEQIQPGLAQTQLNPTPDQLIQLMRSQPPVDVSAPVTAAASFDPPVAVARCGSGSKAMSAAATRASR